MVRLWTWEAIAHGADVVSYFRWRQAPFAQEQMHSGLQRPDGEFSESYEEILQVVEELKNIGDFHTKQADVALMFDYESAWAWETQPQSRDFDYFRLVYEVYSGLRKLGMSIDILPSETEDFGDRKLVLIPGLFAWNDALTSALENFKGQVVFCPRTGSKTPDFQIPQKLPPNLNGFEAKVTSVESLRPSAPINLEGGGQFYIWREHIETSLNIVERDEDGTPAHINEDNLHYLAGWPNCETMTRILKSIAHQAGLDAKDMSQGYRCRTMGSYTLHMNYGDAALKLKGFTLGPAEIALFDNRTQKLLL